MTSSVDWIYQHIFLFATGWVYQHVFFFALGWISSYKYSFLFAMGWIYQNFVSTPIFQRDILNFLSLTDKYCTHTGGLFHFRKGQGTYSIDPADYPLCCSDRHSRLINEFYLLQSCTARYERMAKPWSPPINERLAPIRQGVD
jgi:hypothetical protein